MTKHKVRGVLLLFDAPDLQDQAFAEDCISKEAIEKFLDRGLITQNFGYEAKDIRGRPTAVVREGGALVLEALVDDDGKRLLDSGAVFTVGGAIAASHTTDDGTQIIDEVQNLEAAIVSQRIPPKKKP